MQAVETLLRWMVRLAAALGVLSLVALMGLTVVTVVFRAVGIAFPGTYVLAELLLIPTVSCALAFAAWDGAHTKVELLVQTFRPRIAGLSQGLMLLAGTAFWGIVLFAGIEEAIAAAGAPAPDIADLTNPLTSALTILPLLPVPATCCKSTPSSRA